MSLLTFKPVHLERIKYLTCIKTVSIILLLVLASGGIKFAIVEWGAPVTSDAAAYYTLATQYLYEHDRYPHFLELHNVGFSFVLAGVFWFFPNELNTLSDVQRTFTVILSLVLIPLVYALCRTRFTPRYSLIGAAIISFEPHLIINSALGITEPLFMIFVVLSLYTGLRGNVILGLFMGMIATLVRFEGIMLFVPLAYLATRQMDKRKTIIFCLLLSVVLAGLVLVEDTKIYKKIDKELNAFGYLTPTALVNSVIYMGWAMFPVFIWWIIPGLIKTRDKKFMLVGMAATLIPGLWAYLDAYDTRYFMISYPIVLLISLEGMRWMVRRTGMIRTKILLGND